MMQPLKPDPRLQSLANRYVWWEGPAWAYQHPTVFLANLMEMGTWEDIQIVRKILGDEVLKQVLKEAPPGYFHYRSWDYWHHKFHMTPIPPLPHRTFE